MKREDTSNARNINLHETQIFINIRALDVHITRENVTSELSDDNIYLFDAGTRLRVFRVIV